MIKVNMKQMKNWKVTSDNVKFYDSIMKTKGSVVTLDKRPYVELLCEFNIMFTAK
jgi:enoyl-[acyl-carrier-protein] reductase (NADH)